MFSYFNPVTFEISFKIILDPKEKFWKNLREEFSKKNIFEFWSFISILKKVFRLSFS